MSDIESTSLMMPLPSLNNPKLVQPKSVTGELIKWENNEGKLSVFLVLWIAFHNSLVTQDNAAQVQTQEMQTAIAIQNDLVTQLQGLDYNTLPGNDTKMADITRVNTDNQITQAEISVVQDKNQTMQQLAQVYQSQSTTSGQLASQTIGEAGAVSQLIIDITGDITGR